MDDKRRERRVMRFDLTCRISKLEIDNCHECPKRAKSTPTTCHDCPVFKQLGLLGEELNALCVRENPEKIVEYEPVKPVRKRKKKKSKSEQLITAYLTRKKKVEV